MSKKEIIKFINTQVLPKKASKTWQAGDADGKELITIVQSWRRKNGFPEDMTATVTNGFLFINGTPAGRIANADTKAYGYSKKDISLEGRILARQEMEY
jgi:hypothetical protein